MIAGSNSLEIGGKISVKTSAATGNIGPVTLGAVHSIGGAASTSATSVAVEIVSAIAPVGPFEFNRR